MEISQESPLMTSSSEVSSPEFEFWMVGKNPSLPQPSLLTADELFVDGVLLPLHLLSFSHPNPIPTSDSPPELNVAETPPRPPPPSGPSASPPPPLPTMHPKKRRERRNERSGSAGSSAELNINIWPFSRSRSAGNAGAGSWSRARAVVPGRKASSAPCSRSNSRGESSKPTAAPAATTTTSRRWSSSASRVAAFAAGGIHLGRTNPVWKIHKKITQLADPDDKANSTASTGGTKKGGSNGGVRVLLSFHVNRCIGYRNHNSCISDHASRIAGSGDDGGDGRDAGSSSSLFKLRTIFFKKVY